MLSAVKAATGLYVNWDTVARVDEKTLFWLKSTNKEKPRDVILRKETELAYALELALQEGGREYLVSKSLYDKVNRLFPKRERRLGGNGFNMGRALMMLGLHPLVAYPCRPKDIMYHSPPFKVATRRGTSTPREAVEKGDPSYDHIIFEMTKKSSIVPGKLIFSWDPMSWNGLWDHSFLEQAFNSEDTDVLCLGYAHLLLPSKNKKTDELVDRLSHQDRPMVHLEVGEGSFGSMNYAIRKFVEAGCVDSIGLNEKECVKYLGAKSEDLNNLRDSAIEAAQKFDINRICVHTQNQVFSISRIDTKREVEALRTGGAVASSLTFGARAEAVLPRVRRWFSGQKPVKKRFGKFGFCCLHSFVNKQPQVLTGLGDSFAACQAVVALSG